jgi:hypothetical protein
MRSEVWSLKHVKLTGINARVDGILPWRTRRYLVSIHFPYIFTLIFCWSGRADSDYVVVAAALRWVVNVTFDNTDHMHVHFIQLISVGRLSSGFLFWWSAVNKHLRETLVSINRYKDKRSIKKVSCYTVLATKPLSTKNKMKWMWVLIVNTFI